MLALFKEASRDQRMMMLGATVATIGLAMVGIGYEDFNAGAYVTLVGVVILTYRIHRYGRLGRDMGPEPAPGAKKKKKKRKRRRA